MKKACERFFSEPAYFGATVLRLAFALLFLLAGINKLRMGYGGFASMIVGNGGNLASEAPAVLLYIYGYLLPAAELLAGVLLLFNKYTKHAFALVALMYLSFVFGQMYDGNGSEMTGYLVALLAATAGFHLHDKAN